MSTGAFLMAQTSVVSSQSPGDADDDLFGSWNPASRPEKSPPPESLVRATVPNPPAQPPRDQADSPVLKSQHQSNTADSSSADTELKSAVGEDALPNSGDSGKAQLTELPEATAGSGSNHTPFETGPMSPDPFAELGVSARTNSFPDMDGEPNTSSIHSLPAETDAAARQGDTNGSPSVSRQNTMDSVDGFADPTRLKRTSIAGDTDDGYTFFDQMNPQTKPIYNPGEAESRFEEGLPLVNHSTQSSLAERKDQGSLDEIFKQDDVSDDAGFFSATKSSEPFSQQAAPSLNRKSTSQIINSLDSSGNAMFTDSPTDDSAFFGSIQQEQHGATDDKATAAAQPSPEQAPEEDLEAKWKAELGLDDDDLMDDEGLLPDDEPDSSQGLAAESAASPVPIETPRPVGTLSSSAPTHRIDTAQSAYSRAVYTPHQPSSADLVSGLHAPSHSQHAQPQTPESPEQKPVSFSNQSKAGYQSPYDLPMDIRPKRTRAAPHPPQPAPAQSTSTSTSMPPPPPRSSSILGGRPQSSSSAAAPPPPSSLPRTPDTAPVGPPAAEKPTSIPKNFYEELPTTPRSRPSTRGRYTPQPGPPSSQSAGVGGPMSYAPSQPPTSSPDTSQFPQPEGPNRSASLPVPSPPTSAPSQPSRYSPRPSTSQGAKPSAPRYSPAPPPQAGSPNKYIAPPPNAPPSHNALPFQPRTSSPLAQHEKDPTAAQSHPGRMDGSDDVQPEPVNSYFPTQQSPSSQPAATSHPGADAHHPQHAGPPHATSLYSPLSQSAPDSQMAPPKRSMTQSPSKRGYHPTGIYEPAQRPVSAGHAGPALPSTATSVPSQNARKPSNTPQLEMIAPTDGREADPLERWKGAPIVKFGFGGTILTSFPQYIPRYSAGQVTPKLKANPGEVKTQQFSESSQVPEATPKFPGPLRSKSKKKDVIAWLSAIITGFEGELHSAASYVDQAVQQQREEKLLLWKIVRIMVEHDGVLEGTAEVENKVRALLSPFPEPSDPSCQVSAFSATALGGGAPVSGITQEESKSAVALEQIRSSLLKGDREKAVWEAVDHRLWGHAMMLSSTLDQSVWKQVSQEFVRREVRSVGENAEPLAALYEIFAGNLDESIDELVPVSARAGLQMMSKDSGAGPTKNALDGLNKWRETLTLVLSNRSPQYQHALLALSNLLASYGRVEASHICALFAKSGTSPILGGIQDPHSAIVLLGADHRRYPSTFVNDRNLCRLTEVYEFATSVLVGSPSSVLPHFQSFKLQEAWTLAEEGHRSDAQQYCDAIGSVLKSATKPSPYYHQTFCATLDELGNRLRQAPSDGSSSWISKPSIGKVSGSVWGAFSNFVTGDDSDAASTGSAMGADGDTGPFAKMVGTPPMSTSPSAPDSYFMHSQQAQQHHHTTAMPPMSRYAPRNQSSSPDNSRGRRSIDSQGSPTNLTTDARSYSQRRPSQEPPAPLNYPNYQMPPNAMYGSPIGQPQPSQLLSPVEEAHSSQFSSQSVSVSGDSVVRSQESFVNTGYQPAYVPPQQEIPQVSVAPAQSSYEPPSATGGYEPPSVTGGYEPPSYEPSPHEREPSEEEKPKEQSFLDDEEGDDVAAKAEELKRAERERKNRETAEAVRKAAEEEEAKKNAESQSTEKTGWIKWLTGGKKKEPANAPIRAKLGEENSFYYDENLKRWVNKKDPNSAKPAAQATPPPPKGSAPPSRSASGGNGPPPPPTVPAPTGSPAPSAGSGDGLLAPPRNGSPHPSGSPAPPTSRPQMMARSASAGVPSDSRPISRPGPTLNNASSIDDLIGAPQARKSNTVKPRKKGRGYVDVMAK